MGMGSQRKRRSRVKCLLLAGGLGTRLRPITDHTPKCLVPIGEKPLIDFWFEKLERCGALEVLVNTHHFRDLVSSHLCAANKALDFKIREAFEPTLLGSAGTVSQNRSFMDDADYCFIIYADNFSDIDLCDVFKFHQRHSDPITMLLFHSTRPEECGIATLDEDRRIVSFIEKPTSPESNLANAGIYLVSASAYREIADLHGIDLAHDILPNFVGRMRGLVHNGYHRDIGHLSALRQTRLDAARLGLLEK